MERSLLLVLEDYHLDVAEGERGRKLDVRGLPKIADRELARWDSMAYAYGVAGMKTLLRTN